MPSPPQRILITGASGFVGRRLSAGLYARHPSAALFLADRDLRESPFGQAQAFDLGDTGSIDGLVARTRPEAVVHLAAVSSVPASLGDPRSSWTVNTMGVLDLTLSIRRHVPDCHLVHVSSGEVYGRSAFSGDPVTEDALLLPNNPYAASKAAADILVQEAAERGLVATIVRPFNHTGPGQDDRFVVPAFCRQIAEIEAAQRPPVMQVGELRDERDFLDVADVVDLYIRILERGRSLPSGVVMNAASGAPRRIGDILTALLAMSSAGISVETDQARLRPTRVPRIVGDARRARELLGWTPAIPFEQTLAETLQSWRVSAAG